MLAIHFRAVLALDRGVDPSGSGSAEAAEVLLIDAMNE